MSALPTAAEVSAAFPAATEYTLARNRVVFTLGGIRVHVCSVEPSSLASTVEFYRARDSSFLLGLRRRERDWAPATREGLGMLIKQCKDKVAKYSTEAAAIAAALRSK